MLEKSEENDKKTVKLAKKKLEEEHLLMIIQWKKDDVQCAEGLEKLKNLVKSEETIHSAVCELNKVTVSNRINKNAKLREILNSEQN